MFESVDPEVALGKAVERSWNAVQVIRESCPLAQGLVATAFVAGAFAVST